jgi:hypothetical protein
MRARVVEDDSVRVIDETTGLLAQQHALEDGERDDEVRSREGWGNRAARKGEGWAREGIKRLPYYVPVLSWLPHYQWKEHLLRDVLAGLAVGLMLVPQCIAYSAIVGVPAIYGLYAGWMPVIMYSLFGSTRNLSAGPEGLLCLLVGSGLYAFADEHGIPQTPEAVAPYAAVMGFMVGLFLLIFGFLRISLATPSYQAGRLEFYPAQAA